MFNQQTNEETLIRGCLAGDRRAMEAFYKRFFPSLFPVARRYARDEQEARSLFNTAMLKAFQGLSAFESARSIYPWLKTIVIRTGLDHLRAQFRRQVSAELDAASEVYVDDAAADWLDAEAVQLLIGQLPALTRTVFNLFAMDGYSHGEISETLGITENNSRWHLHSARQQLKHLLFQYESEKKHRPAVA
jgi:RNA polymerase sigma factor (sigma-70 family)